MLTRRHGGFRLGRKLLRVWRWALCHRRRRGGRGYHRLQPCPPELLNAKTNSKKRHGDVATSSSGLGSSPRTMLTWGRSLARRMKLLRHGDDKDRRLRQRLLDVDDDPAAEASSTTPKGQVAVYVGGAGPGEGSMRYLVPVVYFNHPMFGELLREAEAEFGFEHPGGITIPCAASRFERAAAVAAAGGGKKVPGWW